MKDYQQNAKIMYKTFKEKFDSLDCKCTKLELEIMKLQTKLEILKQEKDYYEKEIELKEKYFDAIGVDYENI